MDKQILKRAIEIMDGAKQPCPDCKNLYGVNSKDWGGLVQYKGSKNYGKLLCLKCWKKYGEK